MQDGFLSIVEKKAPHVVAVLRGPLSRVQLPSLDEPTRLNLNRDVNGRVASLFDVLDTLERKGKPYALINYEVFAASAVDKAQQIYAITAGSLSGIGIEEVRTAKPIKTLFVSYEVEGRKCQFLVCTA